MTNHRTMNHQDALTLMGAYQAEGYRIESENRRRVTLRNGDAVSTFDFLRNRAVVRDGIENAADDLDLTVELV